MRQVVTLVALAAIMFAGFGCKKTDYQHEHAMDSDTVSHIGLEPDSARLKVISELADVVMINQTRVQKAFASTQQALEMTTLSISSGMSRPTPDFTDAGVHEMLTNAGTSDPSIITSCVVTGIQNYFAGLVSPSSSSPLYLPYPAMPMVSCSTPPLPEWRTTIGQDCSWYSTTALNKTKFINAIKSYQTHIQSSTTGPFPCYVFGLNYGGSTCSPYQNVQIHKIYDPADPSKIIEFRIILIT